VLTLNADDDYDLLKQALLAAKADVMARTSPTGVTPLHLAASSGNVETIATLLDHKADVNAKESEWGQTPLMFAASENRVDAIKALMAHGADPNITTSVVAEGKLAVALTELELAGLVTSEEGVYRPVS